jgi:hypothetical protein
MVLGIPILGNLHLVADSISLPNMMKYISHLTLPLTISETVALSKLVRDSLLLGEIDW